MEYRSLGRTGVKVSKLCLGCWMFGDRATVAESNEIIGRSLDAGVNFFDTSNVYGGAPGRSETIVGEALAANGKRNDVVLATKVFFPVDPANPNGRGASRRHIIEQCELSLRRLKTDHIDLYYMHRLDPDIPVDEPLRALDDLVRSGKVRYIGASTTAAWQFVEALWVSKELGLNRFVAETPPYNIVDRRIERELLPMAETFGVAVNVWAPIAGGLLSGLYRRGAGVPEGSRYADPRIATAYSHRLNDGVFNVIDAITPLAEAREISPAQFALAWVLQQRGVTTAVTGPEKVGDIVENFTAAQVALSADELAAVDAASPPGGMLSAFYEADANQFRSHPGRVW